MQTHGNGNPVPAKKNGWGMKAIFTTVAASALTTLVVFAATRWVTIGHNTERLSTLEQRHEGAVVELRRLIELMDERRRTDATEQRAMLMKLLERAGK